MVEKVFQIIVLQQCIEKVDLTSNPLPYQHVTLKYFEALVHCKIKPKDGSTKTVETNIVLTNEEENIATSPKVEKY